MSFPPAAATSASNRGHRASPTNPYRFLRRATATVRVVCSIVCVLVLLSDAFADGFKGHEQKSSPIAKSSPSAGVGSMTLKRRDLDLQGESRRIEQRYERGGQANEASSSLLLFMPVRRIPGASAESSDRRAVSSLRIREYSFPSRKVALQGAVRDGLFLKVSLGVDHELERGGIGRARPSVGLQFEKTFR